MKVFQYILYLTSVTLAYSQQIGKEIIVTDPEDFPFYAMFVVKNFFTRTEVHTKTCGGSLIHPEWILTAGHCLPFHISNFEELIKRHARMIFMGSVHRPRPISENARNIVEMHRHPDYAFEDDEDHTGRVTKLQNDIGLIKVHKPYTLSYTVHVIRLSNPKSQQFMYGIAVGVGINWTKSPKELPIVKYLKLPVKETESRSVFYTFDKGGTVEKNNSLRYRFSDISGGPFICGDIYNDPLQIGVISMDIEDSKDNVTKKRIERVDHHLEFIKKYVPIDKYDEYAKQKRRRKSKSSTSKLQEPIFLEYIVIFCMLL